MLGGLVNRMRSRSEILHIEFESCQFIHAFSPQFGGLFKQQSENDIHDHGNHKKHNQNSDVSTKQEATTNSNQEHQNRENVLFGLEIVFV